MGYYTTTEKIKIDSKEIFGDTIKYFIVGKKFEDYYVLDPDYFFEPYDHRYYVSEINSTIIYIDSASNYLNKPVGSLVPLTLPYGPSTFLTRVLLDTIDGVRKKIVGTNWDDETTNLFRLSDDTTTLDTIDVKKWALKYKLVYSKNIGITEEEYFNFEYGYDRSLRIKSIIIYDLSGRKMVDSDFKERLFIGNLKKGIYLITIIESDDLFATYKLIKD